MENTGQDTATGVFKGMTRGKKKECEQIKLELTSFCTFPPVLTAHVTAWTLNLASVWSS